MRHIAIIGSGPAGYYTAEAAQKAFGDDVRVDIFDMMPVPYGLIRSGVKAASDDDGWANLDAVRSHIAKQAPDFDQRTWGYSKLRDLVSAIGVFDVDQRKRSDGSAGVVYIREKRRAAPGQSGTAAAGSP